MKTLRSSFLTVFGACLAVATMGAQTAKIEIIRDGQGVPHVRAQSEADAIFGLGYVHAQDRLWQLEHLRRIGTGRLSEVLGPSALPSDKLFRTLGVTQSAAATWARYGPRQKELVSAYVAGLNAAAKSRHNRNPPLEFLFLNFEPEPWTSQDVLVIAKVLGWSVDENWTRELLRLQLNQALGSARAAQLMPAYTKDGPVIMPLSSAQYASAGRLKAPAQVPAIDNRVLSSLIDWERQVQAVTGLGGQGLGSNNQAVAPGRSTTGSPILASDPHLPSQLPSIFYRVHLTGGGLDVIGATAVGIPGVLMGHNGRIAWSWTNANADVQDLFVERVIGGKDAEYEGRREPLQIRQEIIRVKGMADVPLTVRSSRHGPLVSDVINPNGPALALRWSALDADDDAGVSAYLDANRAGDWDQFTSAFRRFKAHAQNIVFADSEGNIGYQMVGAIPKRAAGDGTVPVPGWNAQFEWTQYIPFVELPSTLNPEQGYLTSSNNQIAPDSYPHKLGNSFAAPYRAARMVEMLRSNNKHSLADMEKMQADVLAVHAREMLPLLLNAPATSDLEREALNLLKKWDFRVTQESAAAAVFEAWYIQLAESVFADDLGDALWRSYSDSLHMVSMALGSLIRDGSEWCDDSRTGPKESCQSIALSALRLALSRMAKAQGTENIASWQWGKVHRTIFFHQPFDNDPLLGPIFNRVTPNGGDKHTVNVASNPRWSEYDQRHVALYRQIIDLRDFENSRWMAAPGQSGLLFDPHYDDSIEDWRQVKYTPMFFSKQSVDEAAREAIVLQPASKN